MHESRRIQQVHQYLKGSGIDYRKMQLVNNNGVPDGYYAGTNGILWIEYKQINLPKRAHTVIVPKLSELQRRFLVQHLEEFSVPCWVVIFTDQWHFILNKPHHWEHGVEMKWAHEHRLLSYKEIANEILQTVN